MRDLAGPNPLHLLPSKGVHLVFSAAQVRLHAAAVIASGAHDRRRVFLIPWGDQVVVGTTDAVYEGPLEAPCVEPDEAEYCCHAVNTAFGLNLRPEDAVAGWAGLRPLPRADATPGGRSDTLSRRHALLEGPPGLITITGGKLTTYRRMAADAVDAAAAQLDVRIRSSTQAIPLGLRGSYRAAVERARSVCAALGLDPAVAEPAVERHGDEAVTLLEHAAAHDEADPLLPGLPYLRAELRWAVEHELALSVDDVLRRRLRVALRHPAAGGDVADAAAALLADALRWDEAAAAASVAEYRERVAGERGVVPLAAPSAA